MNEQTNIFIREHLSDDVRRLALKKVAEGIDLRYALQQIDGRQRAKSKLPKLAANLDVIFPVHLSVEQCSSEATAAYKSSILQAYLAEKQKGGQKQPTVLTDLTGGFGIDFMALAPQFAKAVYVERSEELCEIARHNFPTLGMGNAEIVNAEAEDFLDNPTAEKRLFFMDPARRSAHGARIFAISDCTPDVLTLMPQLKRQGETLFLKLSPMLDWHKAVEDIEGCGANVSEVHIVSVKNECKELLLLVDLQCEPLPETRLICKNDDSVIEITDVNGPDSSDSEHGVSRPTANALRNLQNWQCTDTPLTLFLPNASIMKAGCWDFIVQRYGVTQADRNSHLYFADHEIADFPGKQYRVQTICALNNKVLKSALKDIKKANIAIRNFPMTAAELRKSLKIKDGGDTFLFGTTINGEMRLVVGKIEN